MTEDTNASRLGTRIAMQLALRLRACKPADAEGSLALAAWQRCVHAIDQNGCFHPDDRVAFHLVATSDIDAR
jgi:hypothetical protein